MSLKNFNFTIVWKSIDRSLLSENFKLLYYHRYPLRYRFSNFKVSGIMGHIETKFSLVFCCFKAISEDVAMLSGWSSQIIKINHQSTGWLSNRSFLNDSSRLLLRICKTSILKWIEGVVINQTHVIKIGKEQLLLCKKFHWAIISGSWDIQFEHNEF